MSNDNTNIMHDDYLRDFLISNLNNLKESIELIRVQQDKTEKKVDGIILTIDGMRLNETKHYLNCPNNPDMLELKKKQGELEKKINNYEFYIKNWKVFLTASIAILVVIYYLNATQINRINQVILHSQEQTDSQAKVNAEAIKQEEIEEMNR